MDAILNGCSHAQAGLAVLDPEKGVRFFVDHTMTLTKTLPNLSIFSFAVMGELMRWLAPYDIVWPDLKQPSLICDAIPPCVVCLSVSRSTVVLLS